MALKNSSLYDSPRNSLWESNLSYLQGDSSALFCVVSTNPISSECRKALLSSAGRLGYGIAVAFITLEPEGFSPLEGKELLRVIETLDPLCLVCCDLKGATSLANAYRSAFPLDSATTLLGRPIRAFTDLNRSLQRDDTKQKVWQLLKSLPSLN